MYPVPQRAHTCGRSEEYLGRWITQRKIPRDRVVIATKVAGPSGQMTWIRGGPKCLDATNITQAIDNSLLRMQMDYIDLYQIHWPDRFVRFCYFKCLDICLIVFGYYMLAGFFIFVHMSIRYVGLSNETPYGLMKFIQVAEKYASHLKIVSLQNSYSLLCRTFDSAMAECCHQESISLLAYSPLAMGILSGKYFSRIGGPTDARLNLFKGKYSEGESRYNLSNKVIKAATAEYLNIAKSYGLHPVSLAIGLIILSWIFMGNPAPHPF
ncbi:tas protein [Spatholobus suberectus]|nr:tas protein [Spatholobus suberectus]